jgi:hypothetical protein
VARMGKKSVQGSGGKVRKKNHTEDRSVSGRMGSEWFSGRLADGVLSGFDWLKIGTGGGML